MCEGEAKGLDILGLMLHECVKNASHDGSLLYILVVVGNADTSVGRLDLTRLVAGKA